MVRPQWLLRKADWPEQPSISCGSKSQEEERQEGRETKSQEEERQEGREAKSQEEEIVA